MNIGDIVFQTRRLAQKSAVSTDENFISEAETIFYLRDASKDIPIFYPSFTTFLITGTNITPIPTNTEERLLAYGAAIIIRSEDDLEAAGDSILIRAGSITLDTSKSVKGLSESTKRLQEMFFKMIDGIIIGDPDGVGIGGSRIDNYKTDKNSVLDSEAL